MPEISNLQQRKEQLSEAKKALLEKRLKGKRRTPASDSSSSTPHSTIGVRPAGAAAVATFAQERLWFLRQLHPTSAAYNMHSVVRLRGELNHMWLEQSLQIVVARHGILRTRFSAEDGQLIQHVDSSVSVPVTHRDLSSEPAATLWEQALNLLVSEARLPFDLESGPPLRAVLVKLSPDDWLLQIVMHHIVSDEWSLGIFWREMSVAYERLSGGATLDEAACTLPDPNIQYVDYAHWQREQMGGIVAGEQLSYWRKQLSGDLPQLRMPTDRPHPTVQNQEGALLERQLSPQLAARLQNTCRQNGTTMFVLMLSAFFVLLQRYTGQNDLVVGTPVANRNRPEIQNLIGFFINTLILRADLSGNPTFATLLKQVRERTLDAVSNQDLPFEQLVDALQPERDSSRNPLFQIMFVHQTDQIQQVSLPGLRLEPVKIDTRVSKFDFTLFINETQDRLSAAVEYRTDLFEPSTIQRMLGHLDTLLHGIAQDPNQPVGTLPLLRQSECRQILKNWSGIRRQKAPAVILSQFLQRPAAKNAESEILIHQVIDAQARETPRKIAVADQTRVLTYEEMNLQSDALAAQLQQLGIKPNQCVALCFERSIEMIIAIVGTLKAGGAYVPLDPAYPPDRLAYMLQESGAFVLLTQKQLLTSLPESRSTILTFEPDSEIWCEQFSQTGEDAPPAENRTPAAKDGAPAEDSSPLAYVIFTSGSTGKPKGVMVTHANLVHSTTARFLEYPEQVETFLLLSSFAFDSSIVGIFWTLCTGGKLILPAQGDEKEIQRTAELVQQHEVTHILCLPSLYGVLVDYASTELLLSLKCVIVAGETCPPDLVARHFANLPDTALYNEYGPTEGTVWSSVYRTQPRDANLLHIPIGRPIVNMQSYILDSYQQPVPVGISGELVIGGIGLSAGYIQQSDLTAERFVELEHPPMAPGSFQEVVTSHSKVNLGYRLYHTGDRVRWRADGNIEFLGRLDQQVKVRGHRIELSEIEAVLQALPLVQDAAVLPMDEQLVAYVSASPAAELSEASLRMHLETQLPGPMIPARFVALDTLPKTPTGKVDRNRLRRQHILVGSNSGEHVPPADELEIQLAGIWEAVLKTHPIGRDSHYFNLGGHSLQAIHLFQRIRERFGKDMPLATLFEAPTLARQAAILRNDGWKPDWSVLVPIQPSGTRRPLFCAHAVGGNVLSLRALSQHLGPDQPFYAFQSQGLDGKATVPERVEEIAAYYISEMRTVQPRGPYRLAGQSSGGLIAFEMAHQLSVEGETVALLAMIDTYVPARALEGNAHEGLSLNGRDSVPPPAAIPLRRRMQFHLNRIRRQGPKYLLQRARVRGVKVQVRTRQKVENALAHYLYSYHASRGRPLPPRWRPIYVRSAAAEALNRYRLPIYSGDIHLLRATESIDAYLQSVYGSQQHWRKLTSGSVYVFDIEGGHNLEQEPAVGTLAQKLREILNAID